MEGRRQREEGRGRREEQIITRTERDRDPLAVLDMHCFTYRTQETQNLVFVHN